MSEECCNSFMTEVPVIYFVAVICKNFRFALWLTLIKCHLCTSCQLRNYGSRSIVSEENCAEKLTLTLTQTLTHTGGQFSSATIAQTPEIT